MVTRRTALQITAFAAILVAAKNGPLLAETAPLALKGYDPVAYFTDARPTPGLEQFELLWDGQRYRFASAQHRDLFKANPDKYALIISDRIPFDQALDALTLARTPGAADKVVVIFD